MLLVIIFGHGGGGVNIIGQNYHIRTQRGGLIIVEKEGAEMSTQEEGVVLTPFLRLCPGYFPRRR